MAHVSLEFDSVLLERTFMEIIKKLENHFTTSSKSVYSSRDILIQKYHKPTTILRYFVYACYVISRVLYFPVYFQFRIYLQYLRNLFVVVWELFYVADVNQIN